MVSETDDNVHIVRIIIPTCLKMFSANYVRNLLQLKSPHVQERPVRMPRTLRPSPATGSPYPPALPQRFCRFQQPRPLYGAHCRSLKRVSWQPHPLPPTHQQAAQGPPRRRSGFGKRHRRRKRRRRRRRQQRWRRQLERAAGSGDSGRCEGRRRAALGCRGGQPLVGVVG